jgi:hypothetical protein
MKPAKAALWSDTPKHRGLDFPGGFSGHFIRAAGPPPWGGVMLMFLIGRRHSRR